jgi:MFS family permease
MAATGVLNTGGNLGGLISIPVVAYMSGHHEWTATFVLASAFALLSGLIWLGIDATRQIPGALSETSAKASSDSASVLRRLEELFVLGQDREANAHMRHNLRLFDGVGRSLRQLIACGYIPSKAYKQI